MTDSPVKKKKKNHHSLERLNGLLVLISGEIFLYALSGYFNLSTKYK